MKKITKIELPEREKLIEALSGFVGKTKAMRNASKTFYVSIGTIAKWVKELDIQFDETGTVIIDSLETEKKEAPVIKELDDSLKNMGPLLKEIELEVKPVTLITDSETIADITVAKQAAKQEPNVGSGFLERDIQKVTEYLTDLDTKKLNYEIGYAEYDIKNILVQVDFRQKHVCINGSKDMTFEECDGVLDLLNQII